MYIKKINVQDEILDTSGQLDSKPRYRMRDNDGNILQDNIQLEVKTPVIQEGTAINKALFEEVDEGFRKLSLKSIGNTYLAYMNSELYDLEAYS
jgi:hypothetical protein